MHQYIHKHSRQPGLRWPDPSAGQAPVKERSSLGRKPALGSPSLWPCLWSCGSARDCVFFFPGAEDENHGLMLSRGPTTDLWPTLLFFYFMGFA